MLRAAAAAAVVVAAAATVFALAGDGDPAVEPGSPDTGAPNLLVVMTDDQAVGTFTDDVMPATRAFFADGGTVFGEAIAAPPLCCPSRAGFLTGQYAHNHGVVENDVGYGTMSGKDATLAVRLQADGYRTAMIGKFLNGYERVAGAEPAPGFDHWYAINGYASYRDFQVSAGGELREVAEYATDDLTREAIEFTSAAHGDGDPFFLWLAYNAPHTVLPGSPPPCEGLAAQPRDAATYRRFADAPLPRPASFDADGGDKPSLAGGPGAMRPARVAEATAAWRCALAATAAVDEGIAGLLAALRASGELEDTVVVFLSDNGHFYGEHRVTDDKRLPLDPALRIPLAMRVGAAIREESPPARAAELVSQVDLAPTLLDYAGATECADGLECPAMDGRSLRPLLEASGNWPADRAIPLALDDGWTYRALRTASTLYAEFDASRWATFGEPALELYDLSADPEQLENLAASPGSQALPALGDRLALLSRCSGIEGRDPRSERPFCE